MTQEKQTVELTWLQTQIPRKEWEALNQRRLTLKLRWADIIVPGTKQYLDQLEKQPGVEAETVQVPGTEKPKSKKKSKKQEA